MIFQKMCQSIQSRRRRDHQRLDKEFKPTSDETETITSDNSSIELHHDNGIIEGCGVQQNKRSQQHQDGLKDYVIQSIQEILRDLIQERNVCQMELNTVVKETRSHHEALFKIDVNYEHLFYLKFRIESIQQSIVEFTELQYSVEYNYKTEKQIRKFEKTFIKYWNTNPFQQCKAATAN